MNTEKFAAFCRERRKELGLTQEQLAEKLFVSTAAVSKWERGKSLPDIAKIEDLAAALEVSVLEVLRGELSEQQLPDEPLKEVYVQTLHTANRQWQRKCVMVLLEVLMLGHMQSQVHLLMYLHMLQLVNTLLLMLNLLKVWLHSKLKLMMLLQFLQLKRKQLLNMQINILQKIYH